jgi:hypothetical protein
VTPLGGIQGLPLRILDGHVEEAEERWQERFQ